MFGKLIKHDLIGTGRIMAVVYAIAAIPVVYILGAYFFKDVTEEPSLADLAAIFGLMLVAFINFILTAVVVMSHFQKSLYSDQGYLSFTLPVRSTALLASKLVVTTFWYVAAFGGFIGSFVLIGEYIDKMIPEETLGIFESLLMMFSGGYTFSIVVLRIVMLVTSFFVSFFLMSLEVCFAITLSNTRPFQKHHSLFTIIFSGVSIFVVSKLTSIIVENVVFGFNYDFDTEKITWVFNQMDADITFTSIVSPLVSVAVCIGLFFATRYIMKNKVNLR